MLCCPSNVSRVFYQFKHGPEAVSTYISATNIVVVVVKLNQRTRHVISLTSLNALAVTVARSKIYGERRRSCILRHFAIVTWLYPRIFCATWLIVIVWYWLSVPCRGPRSTVAWRCRVINEFISLKRTKLRTDKATWQGNSVEKYLADMGTRFFSITATLTLNGIDIA